MYFKHNDMESLRNTLEKISAGNQRAKKLRRYIVVEAVYQVYIPVVYIGYNLYVWWCDNSKKNILGGFYISERDFYDINW